MIQTESPGYYAEPSKLTTLGPHEPAIKSLPDDVAELIRVIQNLCIYDVVAADFYGVSLSAERQEAIHLRSAADILDAALSLDARPLTAARPGADRLASRCDHYARLLTAMLRAKGVPARARCGFADYFNRGTFEDHWVCEYLRAKDQRWVLVDAQLDEVWREKLHIDFDPQDVPRDRFLVAGQAWQQCRSGRSDAEAFGIGFVNMRGLWFVAGNVVRDVAALNKVEMLPWDIWGAQPKADAQLDPGQIDHFDQLAGLTLAPDANVDELRSRYEKDDGLRVPERVYNGLRRQMEAV